MDDKAGTTTASVGGLKTAQQAADYLGSGRSTLDTWRKQGKGPRAVRRHGVIRFRVTDLDSFILERLEG